MPFLSYASGYASEETASVGALEAVLSVRPAADWLRGAGEPLMASDRPVNGHASRADEATDQDTTTRKSSKFQKEEPEFRNREAELERIEGGVTNPAGPHFWLVTAPPQMGKTWFLNRVRADWRRAGWVSSMIDLRAEPVEVVTDPAALLGRMFNLGSSATAGQETLFAIAERLVSAEQPRLCLLDGAEVLDQATAATLRSSLSEIYHLVDDAAMQGVWLALVVASRREDYWRSATNSPRLSVLALSEFSRSVVEQAVFDLVKEMGRDRLKTNWRSTAATIHQVTEGLPALLSDCLSWIRQRQGIAPGRLESREHFEELAGPYINEVLLSRHSLFPGPVGQMRLAGGEIGKALHALGQAYSVLAPYRLFTQSHLRNHMLSDTGLQGAVEGAHWSLEDLWNVVSGSALQQRPLDEPWQKIHPAIRRLLYRYFYATLAVRAEAHERALEFVKVWSAEQLGTEQIVGLIECLWHQATARRGEAQAEFERGLAATAEDLSRDLKSSPAYTVAELRQYAADRMSGDEELRAAISHIDGLFDRLVEIVKNPGSAADAGARDAGARNAGSQK